MSVCSLFYFGTEFGLPRRKHGLKLFLTQIKKKYYPRGWKPERLKKSLVFIYAEKVTNGKGNSYFCVLIDVLWIYSISTTIGTAGTLPFTAKLRFNEQIVTSLYAIDVIDAN